MSRPTIFCIQTCALGLDHEPRTVAAVAGFNFF
jgi:hypothetical protein